MDFETKFILELFLDDSISTVNRLVVATANVASENLENLEKFNVYEHKYIPQSIRRKYNKNNLSNDKQHKEKFDYYRYLRKYFTDTDYLNNFKMKMYTVKELIKYLKDFVKGDTTIIPLDKKVHIFLYTITSDLSFYEIGEKFGLHKSSVSYIFHEIASLISEQRFHFINWPSPVEQHITRMKVNSRYGFPNCVGFIDACKLQVGSKRKRNQNCNILVQAVCDESLMFTDVYVGDIGNTKKNKVFKESPLAKNLKDYVDLENHILGDSSYKLRDNLITPYSGIDTLSIEEIKFNETHWNSRKHIGLALQMLRDRFKKINHIDICKPQAVKTVIYAACVLHNFTLLHEGHTQLKEENNLSNYSITFDTNIVTTAAEKRQFLCNYMASFTPNVLSSTDGEHTYCQQSAA